MKLFAISDLHIGSPQNLLGIRAIPHKPDDWLIVAGDIGERENDVIAVLQFLSGRFAKVLWTPGNHELWTTAAADARGAAKYDRLVERCRAIGVLTPEDPYPVWRGEGGPHVIATTFTLYDYSFADDGVPPEEALRQAAAAGIVCTDEAVLHPDPFPTRALWCEHRCRLTEVRLEAAVREHSLPLVIVNHYPLKRAHAVLPAVPPFKIWCGTRRTEDWPARFGVKVVVSGHLHIRSTRVLDGTRYEEVSLGHAPRQWVPARGVERYLRQILPHPEPTR